MTPVRERRERQRELSRGDITRKHDLRSNAQRVSPARRQQRKVEKFLGIEIRRDRSLLAQEVEIAAGDLGIEPAVFVEQFDQSGVGLLRLDLTHFKFVGDYLRALGAVDAQPRDGVEKRRKGSANSVPIVLDFG